MKAVSLALMLIALYQAHQAIYLHVVGLAVDVIR